MSKNLITPACALIGCYLGDELTSSKRTTDNSNVSDKSNLGLIAGEFIGIIAGSSIEYALGNKKSFAKLLFNAGAMMSLGALIGGTISIINSSDDELESSQNQTSDKIEDSIAYGAFYGETIAVVGSVFYDLIIHH